MTLTTCCQSSLCRALDDFAGHTHKHDNQNSIVQNSGTHCRTPHSMRLKESLSSCPQTVKLVKSPDMTLQRLTSYIYSVLVIQVMKIGQIIRDEFDGGKDLSGIGGVETGRDAAEFLLLGANSVQVSCPVSPAIS